MSELTLQLPDNVVNRLQNAADRYQIPLDDLVREAIENYLNEEEQPTKEALLKDLGQSMRDALIGRTRPAMSLHHSLQRSKTTSAPAIKSLMSATTCTKCA